MAEIYFGKINLVSSQIGDVLFNATSLRSILTNLFMAIKDDITYTYSTTRKIDEDTILNEDIEYSITVKEKTDSDLQGYLHKKSYLYYKDFDKNEKKQITKKVENTESSEFYYDIYREMVGYQRTQRFGYIEFLYGFQGILNSACAKSNLDYSFTVDLYNDGLDINDIRRALQDNNEKIQKLSIKFQIPNPDDETLKKIHINPEETINNFKAANLSTKYVTYQAFSNSSLNISSDLIEQELQSIDNLHSSIDAKKATQNGYVEVETTDIHGITKSTAEARPVKKHIDNIIELKEAASSVILSHVRNSISENYIKIQNQFEVLNEVKKLEMPLLSIHIDGYLIKGNTVKEFYRKIMEVLINKNIEIEDKVPFATGNIRYLINYAPTHVDGSEFTKPMKVGKYYLETHKSKKDAYNDMLRFLRNFTDLNIIENNIEF